MEQQEQQYDYLIVTYKTYGRCRIPKGAEYSHDSDGILYYKYEGKLFKVDITLDVDTNDREEQLDLSEAIDVRINKWAEEVYERCEGDYYSKPELADENGDKY